MKDQLITYETATLAKLKGFDIKCNEFFKGFETERSWIRFESDEELKDDCFERPTREQLSQWLREKEGLFVNMIMDFAFTVCCRLGNEVKILESSSQDDPDYAAVFEKGLQSALNTLPNAI